MSFPTLGLTHGEQDGVLQYTNVGRKCLPQRVAGHSISRGLFFFPPSFCKPDMIRRARVPSTLRVAGWTKLAATQPIRFFFFECMAVCSHASLPRDRPSPMRTEPKAGRCRATRTTRGPISRAIGVGSALCIRPRVSVCDSHIIARDVGNQPSPPLAVLTLTTACFQDSD